jgi:hypothetical protein
VRSGTKHLGPSRRLSRTLAGLPLGIKPWQADPLSLTDEPRPPEKHLPYYDCWDEVRELRRALEMAAGD